MTSPLFLLPNHLELRTDIALDAGRGGSPALGDGYETLEGTAGLFSSCGRGSICGDCCWYSKDSRGNASDVLDPVKDDRSDDKENNLLTPPGLGDACLLLMDGVAGERSISACEGESSDAAAGSTLGFGASPFTCVPLTLSLPEVGGGDS